MGKMNGKAGVTKGDVYAAGLTIGRMLVDGHVDRDTAAQICAVIRALEDQAG
jgi:hypothetical protein